MKKERKNKMIQFIFGLMAGAVAVSLMHWAAECYIEKKTLAAIDEETEGRLSKILEEENEK